MRRVVCFAGLAAVAALALPVVLQVDALLAHRRITTTITWDREISAILAARCVQCHRPGGRAPMPLTTYAEARPWARAIRHEVVTRRMPVWHAARGYGEFANDPSLSPHEIALIAAWVDGGAPQSLVPFGTVQRKPVPSRPLIPAQPFAPPPARTVSAPCDAVSPRGMLLGLRPTLGRGGEVRIVLENANDPPVILAWIRDYEPKANETYWLREPRPVGAAGRIVATGTAPCALTLLLAPAGR
jgi:hypothetical protein